MKNLLIEIGVEELPAIPFLKELKNIPTKWANIFEKYGFSKEFKFYYTPRRIIFSCDNFNDKQKDFTQEFFGPPLKIAYKDDKPTPALIGFAKKCNTSIENLNKIEKNNQEVLYFKQDIKGKYIQECIEDMVDEFLKSLNFGQDMRWGKNKFSFIRPIRWICAKLDSDTLEFNCYGIKSDTYSKSHRQNKNIQVEIPKASDYFDILKQQKVIINQEQRKEIILKSFEKIEQENNITVIKDNALLDELVCITEYPIALLGSFDEKFLQIPQEVIILSMKEHQRYFSISKNDTLMPNFLVIADCIGEDSSKILDGNKRVLLARLEDALFFYQNDLKEKFQTQKLEDISYMNKMGSMLDKVNREKSIGEYLSKNLNCNSKIIDEAISISKSDLLTQVVYEFTSLQGLMGFYYAKAFGHNDEVALCIKEQYLPDSSNSPLPSNKNSAIVALSNKLDLLYSLFSTNQIPTGSKDPYALRRAVIGIIKIVIKFDISFDIKQISNELQKIYKPYDTNKIIEFFNERMYKYFEENPSLIQAVLNTNNHDINEINKKINALGQCTKNPSFRDDFSTFKRVSNILEKENIDEQININEKIFENEYEKRLFENITKIINNKYENYQKHLDDLFSLNTSLADFFEHTMVNAEDKNLQINRKNILKLIYNEFKKIADIKVISL